MKDPNLEPSLTNEEIAYMRWLENPQSHTGAVPPAWTKAQQAFQPIQRDLQQSMLPPLEPPYPDFFNSQLMRRVTEEISKTVNPPISAPTTFWARAYEWLFGSSRGWAWGAVGATAAVVCLSWLGQKDHLVAKHTAIISAYSPELGKVPHIKFSKEAQAIVIDLQGLKAYPADRAIIGMVGEKAETLVAAASVR